MKRERPERQKSPCMTTCMTTCMTWEPWERGRHERAGNQSAAVYEHVGRGVSRLGIRSGRDHLVGRFRLSAATAARAGRDRHARPDLLGPLHLELRILYRHQ